MSSPRKTRRSGKEKIERTLAKLTTLIEKHCGTQVEIATEAAERALIAVGATPRPQEALPARLPSVLANQIAAAESSMAALRAAEGAPAAFSAAAPSAPAGRSLANQIASAEAAMAAMRAQEEPMRIVTKKKRAPTCPGGPKLFNAFIKAIVDTLTVARPGLPYEEYRAFALPYWNHVKAALCGQSEANAVISVRRFAARALELILQNWPRKNHTNYASVVQQLSPAATARVGFSEGTTLPAFVEAARAVAAGEGEENMPVIKAVRKSKKGKTRKANNNAARAAVLAEAASMEQAAANAAAENAARRRNMEAAAAAAPAARRAGVAGRAGKTLTAAERNAMIAQLRALGSAPAAAAMPAAAAAVEEAALPASRLSQNNSPLASYSAAEGGFPVAAAAPAPAALLRPAAAPASAGRLNMSNEGQNNMGVRKVRISGQPYFYNNSTGALFMRNNTNNSYGAEIGTWNNNAGQIRYSEQ